MLMPQRGRSTHGEKDCDHFGFQKQVHKCVHKKEIDKLTRKHVKFPYLYKLTPGSDLLNALLLTVLLLLYIIIVIFLFMKKVQL